MTENISSAYRDWIEAARNKNRVLCHRCKYAPQFACYDPDEEVREKLGNEYCYFEDQVLIGAGKSLLRNPICPYWVSVTDPRIRIIEEDKYLTRSTFIKPCPFGSKVICYDTQKRFCTHDFTTCNHSRVINFNIGISKAEFDELRKSAGLSYYDISCIEKISEKLISEGVCLKGWRLEIFWDKVTRIHHNAKELPPPPCIPESKKGDWLAEEALELGGKKVTNVTPGVTMQIKVERNE